MEQSSSKSDTELTAGEVGIFWFITPTEILQDSVPYLEGYDDGEFVNGPSGHYTYWESLKKQIPNLVGVEYDKVPRGRVVYSKKDGVFIVYGSKAMISDEKMRALVRNDFNLNDSNTRFVADSHYEMDCLISLISEEFDA